MESEIVPSASTLEPKTERIIKKVPGKIPPVPKENDVYMKNLSEKRTVDLQELLERQEKILSNKFLVSNLADKGKKVAELKQRIEQELKSRNEVDKAADLLSEMNIGQLNALEWTGHCNPGHRKNNNCASEAEEMDPLKIMASHCGTTANRKQIRILEVEESLIKAEDLRCPGNDDPNESSSIPTFFGKLEDGRRIVEKRVTTQSVVAEKEASSQSHVANAKGSNAQNVSGMNNICSNVRHKSSSLDEPEPFAHFICERYGHNESQERFKPNKPLKPFTGVFPIDPPGRVSCKPKRWEETNVTPPMPVYADTKLLTLEESLEIQREQNRKLKEVQIRHAADKLSSLSGLRMADQIPPRVLGSMAYRCQTDSNSDSEHELNEADLEDQELHDEDQQDRCTTVVYSLES